MIKRRRGISPVIAIVILIAVAVALGIAVAFWATGLIGTLGKVEKLEIRTAYASGSGPWTVYMSGANTGTADITIVQITINGRPISGVTLQWTVGTGDGATTGSSTPIGIEAGKNFELQLTIPTTGYTSGQTIEVALISGSGTAFKRTVVLP